MLVGEQPGDQEDKQGHPFVGPAGRVLWRCLERGRHRARVDVFVTNAVKHFKHEHRGKRRLHKKPNTAEVEACHPWVDAEFRAVGDASSSRSARRPPDRCSGVDVRSPPAAVRMSVRSIGGRPSITYHPSAVLRADEAAAEIRSAIVADLRELAAAWLAEVDRVAAHRLLRLVVQGLARDRVPEKLPQRRWFEHYADAVRHGRAQQHLLPAAAAGDGRASGRQAARPGFVYAREARRVRFAPDEARATPRRGCPNHLDRVARLGDATSARPSCSSRRGGSATSNGSTSSSPSAPTTMRWAVELRDPSWVHDDVFDVLRRHGAALCVHDLLADHPLVLHDGLDLRALPRARRHRAALPRARTATAGSDVSGRPTGDVARRGLRRVRLLQQRLVRPRGHRRHLATSSPQQDATEHVSRSRTSRRGASGT